MGPNNYDIFVHNTATFILCTNSRGSQALRNCWRRSPQIAMRWRDNVFVEHLWRSVKYERVYLKAYEGVSAARAA